VEIGVDERLKALEEIEKVALRMWRKDLSPKLMKQGTEWIYATARYTFITRPIPPGLRDEDFADEGHADEDL
jgi:hypothetical protein